LIWLFQRKHVAGFSEQKDARQKNKDGSGSSLFFHLAKTIQEAAPETEKYSWMKVSAEPASG